MKNISFRFPISIRDIKVLWKEYTSKRYRKNIEVMRKMTDFYIRNVLKGRWGEVADGKVVKWSDADKRQFEKEMLTTIPKLYERRETVWIPAATEGRKTRRTGYKRGVGHHRRT